jgi:hypothetical protein
LVLREITCSLASGYKRNIPESVTTKDIPAKYHRDTNTQGKNLTLVFTDIIYTNMYIYEIAGKNVGDRAPTGVLCLETSLNTTRPSTIFYSASLRRHQERSLRMAM